MNPKRVTLAVLLMVLIGCLFYAYRAMPRLEKAPPRAAGERVRVAKGTAPSASAPAAQARLDFGDLSVEPQPFPGAKRDIFRYGGRPPVSTAAPVPVPAVGLPVDHPPLSGAPPTVAPVPIEVVQKALGQFTFLGFLDKAGEKTVFLSSSSKLFLAKRGDRFGVDDEFMVESVEGNLLKVRHPGRAELVEIPLIEKQKLNAAVSAPVKLPPRVVEPVPATARPFTPQRRILRPAAPEAPAEEPVQEATEETAPGEKQAAETPADGAAAEGDVNVKTQ